MIPNIDILTNEITEIDYGNETYKIKIVDKSVANTQSRTISRSKSTVGSELGTLILGVSRIGTISEENSDTESEPMDRINGLVDGIEAVKQTIYCILSTERYQYLIYSWDYGVELIDLYGKPMSYVMSELPRRIEEALTTDDRIDSVTDFEFEQNGKKLHTTFTVVTNVGNLEYELEVEV